MHFVKCFWFVFLCSLISSTTLKGDFHCKMPVFNGNFIDLPKQDRALIRDLKLLNYPPTPWKIEPDPEALYCYDVVIVGAGMAGLTAGAALFKEGIFNIKIFDQNDKGYEGPWINYARMKTLRSSKELMGPALDIPHLTFHAWYEAQWEADSWKQLAKIPNSLWMDYLNWYRQTMQLPVENNCHLIKFFPMQNYFELEFQKEDHTLIVKARKVILATGRGGFGGPAIPDYVKHLPKSLYAHTIENIPFEKFKNLHIGIIGAGASAFDSAAVALELGAKTVDLIMRRSKLPNVNKFASLYFKSFSHGFYKLSDEKRWNFMSAAFDAGIPPPIEALKRVQGQRNFLIRSNTKITQIHTDGSQIHLETNQGPLTYDFLILATGFNINGKQQPELQPYIDQIALWEDRMPNEIVKAHPNFGHFPYLGPCFEFLPKVPKTAQYLSNLYCFNYGATLSHGLISSDIPAISIGAKRLAEGIAADFFIQDSDIYLERLKNFQEFDFDQDQFFPK